MEIYFEATGVSDPTQSCKGKVKVLEINQNDDEVQLEITQEKPGDFVKLTHRAINKAGPDLLLKTIMGLTKAMQNKDVDDIKVKKD